MKQDIVMGTLRENDMASTRKPSKQKNASSNPENSSASSLESILDDNQSFEFIFNKNW